MVISGLPDRWNWRRNNSAVSTDPLQARRQPLVTATGIILGFVLNFASGWVRSDTTVGERLAWAIALLIAGGMVCLIVVLTRILSADVELEQADAHYRATTQLFTVGVSAAVSGILIDMGTAFWDS